LFIVDFAAHGTVFDVFFREQVGDIVSIIDMPPAHESSWWRGKNRFEV